MAAPLLQFYMSSSRLVGSLLNQNQTAARLIERPALERQDIGTAAGWVRFWGRFRDFRVDRPLVFAVRGAFPSETSLDRLPDLLPDSDVVLAHLPGMWSPHLQETSIQAFSDAFDEALQTTFPDRRILRFGISAGGLVVLGMQLGESLVAVDPPLTTSGLWPVRHLYRQAIIDSKDPLLAEWVWNIFGVGPDVIEERNYRPLLEKCRISGTIIIAGIPLEPKRAINTFPGLISKCDRQFISHHPTIRSLVVSGKGHNLVQESPQAVLNTLRRSLNDIIGNHRSS